MNGRILRKCLDVVKAELTGGESEVTAALSLLDASELSQLRNALHNVAELAERRRKILWRNR